LTDKPDLPIFSRHPLYEFLLIKKLLELHMASTDALQIDLDHDLARDLQANPEAQNLGVPEFVQRAVRFYLRRCEELEIRRQYQKGYGGADLTDLELEMKDWEEEQAWPEP
jgi:hypothetical protein